MIAMEGRNLSRAASALFGEFEKIAREDLADHTWTAIGHAGKRDPATILKELV